MKFYRYFFGLFEEGGREFPFSRFDLVLSIILSMALMVGFSYMFASPHEWTTPKAIALLLAVAIVSLLPQRRRIVWGTAIGIVAGRFLIGLVLGVYPIAMIVGALTCGVISWLLLRVFD